MGGGKGSRAPGTGLPAQQLGRWEPLPDTETLKADPGLLLVPTCTTPFSTRTTTFCVPGKFKLSPFLQIKPHAKQHKYRDQGLTLPDRKWTLPPRKWTLPPTDWHSGQCHVLREGGGCEARVGESVMQPGESSKASWGAGDYTEAQRHMIRVKGMLFQPRDVPSGKPTLHVGQAMVNIL